MNKTIIILGILLFSFFSCVPDPDPVQLAVPENLQIIVVGREMTVTWDAVKNASGYILYTTSVGCGSGNRIVNTATKTVRLHNPPGGQATGTIVNSTTFRHTLMAASGSTTEAMASSLTAKVMSVGDGETYIDSEYSDVVTLRKADYD